MKRAVISAADLAALRRQLPAKSLAALVGRIERGYRAALAVEGFDDAVVVATLNSASQSETERAGLRVIRAWIAYRETDGRADTGGSVRIGRRTT